MLSPSAHTLRVAAIPVVIHAGILAFRPNDGTSMFSAAGTVILTTVLCMALAMLASELDELQEGAWHRLAGTLLTAAFVGPIAIAFSRTFLLPVVLCGLPLLVGLAAYATRLRLTAVVIAFGANATIIAVCIRWPYPVLCVSMAGMAAIVALLSTTNVFEPKPVPS